MVNQGESVYEQVTHGDGFIRDFFKKIKAMTHSYTIDRIFITGVTPMAMNDLTSGFNIGDNISFEPNFTDMVGVTEQELNAVIDYFVETDTEKTLIKKVIKLWYNGYSFDMNNINKKLYNTTALWNYMKFYYHNHKPPSDLLDPNIRTDFEKLKYLLFVDGELNGNFSVLNEVLE